MIETAGTINEIFMKSVAGYDSPRAFAHKQDGKWRQISHRQALERIRCIALGLHSIGVRKSEQVLLLAENSLEWILADLGTLFCGAVDVPVYHSSTPAQVEYIVRDSAARVAFVSSPEQLEKLRGVRAAIARIVLFLDAASVPGDDSVISLDELEQRGRELSDREPGLFDALWQGIQPADPATLIYTSGTTGTPKGVPLSHGNIASNVLAIFAALKIARASDLTLSFLPFTHIFERNNLYGYLNAGISLWVAESLAAVGGNLLEVRPTMITAVPRVFEKIYQRLVQAAASGGPLQRAIIHWSIETGRRGARLRHQGKPLGLGLRLGCRLAYLLVFRHLRARLGGRIRYMISGGAALSPDIAYLFLAAGLPILQGYGLTEASPVISVNPFDANRIGTVGKPLPGIEVRISEDGEILTRGPNVMSGYYRLDAETQAAFHEGWLRTGDLGYLDPEGYLVITDRKKNLFKTSGGKYIAPMHVENCILSSRFISQVMVIGNSRRFPSALIVPNAEMIQSYAALKGISAPDYAGLLRHPQVIGLIERQVAKYTEGLARYEKVKRFVLLEQEFTAEAGELTATLKLRRREVEMKYQALIDALYVEPGLEPSDPDGGTEQSDTSEAHIF